MEDHNKTNPWNELLRELWGILTKGNLKYITIPLFLLFFAAPWVNGLIDGGTKLYDKIELLLSDKLSYPLPSEEDCFDEWVVLIALFDNEDKANQEFERFKSTYQATNHQVWKNDLFLVRNYKKKNEWLIIIDTYHGASSEEDVNGAITNLWRFADRDRETKNTLGHWLYGARPIYYSKARFQETHGKIATLKKDTE